MTRSKRLAKSGGEFLPHTQHSTIQTPNQHIKLIIHSLKIVNINYNHVNISTILN